MAYLIPDNLKSRSDVAPALRRVANAFQIALDDNVTVWFEPLYDPAGDKPHFVLLLPDRGIAVLEVFEAKAKNILGFIRGRLRFERDGREVEVHSPLERAEHHAAAIRERISSEPRLAGLDIRVVAGAVFPGMTEEEARDRGVPSAIGSGFCLFKSLVDAAVGGTGESAMLRVFAQALGERSIELDRPAIDMLRGLIQPSIVIDAITKKHQQTEFAIFRPPSDGSDVVRVMDRTQEAMAKSLGDGHRVIRGVAGSGKTLILVYRARLMARANPQKRYLLTCFTKTLASQLSLMLADVPNVTVRHLDGVMFDVFRARNMRFPGHSGDDAGERVAQAALEALRGTSLRYDGIFVDEAQDFGTAALQFVVALLREGNDDLVIVADAAQNIFRRQFSWKQAGIKAQGRTRILRTNYRNTKEILEFAYRFLTSGSLRSDEVPDMEDESAVIPPEAAHRTGPVPAVTVTPDPEKTVAAVVERVRTWLRRDQSPRSIAILYASSKGAVMEAGLISALQEAGIEFFWATDPADRSAKSRFASVTEPVIVSTIYSAKGLEFPRVVLCELGKRDDDPEVARKLAYVGMTRATDELFVVTDSSDRLEKDLHAAQIGDGSESAA